MRKSLLSINFLKKINKKQNDLINFLINNDFIRKNEIKNNIEINEDYININLTIKD